MGVYERESVGMCERERANEREIQPEDRKRVTDRER